MLRGGTTGNARLTALSGLIILVLLAAEGFTLISIRSLITPHAFIGIMLLPPIGLKLASVGYRFFAYYAGNTQYRLAGPPHPFPRLLAPFLVAATVLLFGTGIILLLTPPAEGDIWLQAHKMTFFAWFFLMSAHVLTYLLRALNLAHTDLGKGRKHGVKGSLARQNCAAGSILLGVALAIVFLPWDATWAHWFGSFRQDH